MTGDSDYLLRIVVPDLEAYERFVMDFTKIAGIAQIRSSFALRTVKQGAALPLGRHQNTGMSGKNEQAGLSQHWDERQREQAGHRPVEGAPRARVGEVARRSTRPEAGPHGAPRAGRSGRQYGGDHRRSATACRRRRW